MANVSGLPGNWAQLMPAEKRQFRVNRFLNPTNVQFASPEAARAYRIRARRIVDAYNVEEPDQVPVALPVGNLPLNLHGVSMHEAMYDVTRAVEACEAFNSKYAEELEYFAAPMVAPGRAMEILDYKLYAWPGHGLAATAPGYQFVEGEYMKAAEYDDFIRDPSDFWLRTYLPRVFGSFESFRSAPPLPDIIEIPTGQLMSLADDRLLDTFQKLIDAGREIQKWIAASGRLMGLGAAHGYPSAMGMLNFAPFDSIGDTLRGTKGVVMDMFRHGDKLLAAVDKMTELTIHSLLHNPMFAHTLTVVFPLHKGADGWMSPRQFDTFYWPSLKRVMDALINEGVIPVMFAEGSYNTRLESVTDFPKGSVVWWFDQTDMVKAKKVLGGRFCIQGNVPSSLTVTGSAEAVKEHCRKLIEACAPGGGYILGAGCVADDPKLDNLRAMLAAVKEYGVYRK